MDMKEEDTNVKVHLNGRLISTETKMREWERYSFASSSRPEGLSPLPDAFDLETSDNISSPREHDRAIEAYTSTQEAILGTSTEHVGIVPFPTDATRATLRVSSRTGSQFSTCTTIVQPFSWATGLDWTTLSNALKPDGQMIKLWKPDLIQLNSMFYTTQRGELSVQVINDSLVLRHLVASLLNGINGPGSARLEDVYACLMRLPRDTAFRFFQSLPFEALDVIRQKIFVAAVKQGDAETVKTMLELGYDLRESVLDLDCNNFSNVQSLKICNMAVARIIVSHASKVCNSQDSLLEDLLKLYRDDHRHLPRLDWGQLIQIPLNAGAMPVLTCFVIVRGDTNALDYLFVAAQKDITYWLQQGLLTTAIAEEVALANGRTLVNWVLSQLEALVCQQSSPPIHAMQNATAIGSPLCSAFQAALKTVFGWITEAIYNICHMLEVPLHYCRTDLDLNETIMRACRERDWKLANATACGALLNHSQARRTWYAEFELRAHKITDEDDYDSVHGLLCDFPFDKFDYVDLTRAIRSSNDYAAVVIISRTNSDGLLQLLEANRLRAISILLRQDWYWNSALQHAGLTCDYSQLEDLLFRIQPSPGLSRFPHVWTLETPDGFQIVLRALSYHAIYQGDTHLLSWLHKHGLTTKGISVSSHERGEIYAIATVPGYKDKLVGKIQEESYWSLLPSLLEVAVQQNNVSMVRYLHALDPDCRDSDSLLHAVRMKAQPSMIRLLLNREEFRSSQNISQYGCAALREAIRCKNYDLVRMLAEKTDIHGLERVDKNDPSGFDNMDSLGESIVRDDHTAVQILLDKGADPDALVVFCGLQESTPRSANYSALLRMTALLVAIDMGSISMVQLLVKHGANINRESDMGLLRTPLQRAAEIGDFDLVRYFLNHGAQVDSIPVYGGGTALQLAAMSGHVGIATLLLEHGADPNYPPAKGPGRTAFEAAAEWCRPDMMHLLMNRGTRLDLEITQTTELYSPSVEGPWSTMRTSCTQYERAIQFADERGQQASKRIVQRLFRETFGDLRPQPYQIEGSTMADLLPPGCV